MYVGKKYILVHYISVLQSMSTGHVGEKLCILCCIPNNMDIVCDIEYIRISVYRISMYLGVSQSVEIIVL